MIDHARTNNDEDIKVSLLFTESTSSLLQLEIPYLEDLHPSDTTVCIITQSETNYKKPIKCGADIRYRNTLKEWDSSLKSEIAFFSDTDDMKSSTTLFDDLSNLSLTESDTASSQNLPNILKPRRIKTRPLVTVRSIAHADNLTTSSNKLCVSLIDIDGETSTEYMCRICHGGASIDDLLTPCRCRGTVALAHLECLQRWLKESTHSYCELCQHHYQIIREPKYSLLWSIFVFLRHPGNHWREILLDLFAFAIYTPSAVASNYMLLILCDSLARINIDSKTNLSTHVMAFTALLGIAAIDFTYTSWLFTTLEKHIEAWSEWYKSNCKLKVILPKTKMKPFRMKRLHAPETAAEDSSCVLATPQE